MSVYLLGGTNPPITDEFTDGAPEHNMLCGQCALACALGILGHSASADAINAWIKSPSGLHHATAGGTYTGWLKAACNHLGVPASEVNWALEGAVTSGLSAGYPVVVAIYSDGFGTPRKPPPDNIGHFVTVHGYRENPSRQYRLANPGGARHTDIDATYLESCAQNSSLIVGTNAAQPRIYVSPAISAGGAPAPVEDSPMTNGERWITARAMVLSWYVAAGHRQPPVADVDGWAKQILAAYASGSGDGPPNIFAIMQSFLGSIEMRTNLAADFARDHLTA